MVLVLGFDAKAKCSSWVDMVGNSWRSLRKLLRQKLMSM
jgi:hypothetical protein